MNGFQDELPADATEEEKIYHAKREALALECRRLSTEARNKCKLLEAEIKARHQQKNAHAPDYDPDLDHYCYREVEKMHDRVYRKSNAAWRAYAKMPSVVDARKHAQNLQAANIKAQKEAEIAAAKEAERNAVQSLVNNYNTDALQQFGRNVRIIAETVSEKRRHDEKRPSVVLHPTLTKIDQDGYERIQLFEIRPVKWNRIHGFDMTWFSISRGADFKVDMHCNPSGDDVKLKLVRWRPSTVRNIFADLILLIEQNASLDNFFGIGGSKCLVCGHALTEEESRSRSVGPECWKHIGEIVTGLRKPKQLEMQL